MPEDSSSAPAAVSVSAMARQVGLSRQRFYQLIGTAFPPPVYDPRTRRPFYPPKLQAICLEVRRRNCGIDGRPVLFYAPRPAAASSANPSRRSGHAGSKRASGHQDQGIVHGVRALGLQRATDRQIRQAVAELYPRGPGKAQQAEAIRAVFVHLMRRDSGDKPGR